MKRLWKLDFDRCYVECQSNGDLTKLLFGDERGGFTFTKEEFENVVKLFLVYDKDIRI